MSVTKTEGELLDRRLTIKIERARKQGKRIGYATCLYEKCGYSFPQIAEEMGITESAVRNMLKDVVKKD